MGRRQGQGAAVTERADTPLAHRLRVLMCEQNLKQKDVAERAGVSQAYVSDLLHGRRDMTPKALEKLCDAIDVDDNTRANLHVMGARLDGWNV